MPENKSSLEFKIDRLSTLARETQGASFVIQHDKGRGKFKVVFNNFSSSSNRILKSAIFEEAIDEAIEFLLSNRKSMEVPEKYTLY